MSKLLLVDGSALLHRAYHAYPPLTSKTGSGRAVYGVTSILISALDSEKPSHAMVAWDLPNQPFVMLSMGYRQRPKARRDGRADTTCEGNDRGYGDRTGGEGRV